jgi:hypothetical protein
VHGVHHVFGGRVVPEERVDNLVELLESMFEFGPSERVVVFIVVICQVSRGKARSFVFILLERRIFCCGSACPPERRIFSSATPRSAAGALSSISYEIRER